MKKRTDVDFSNHELFVTKNDDILIHHFKHKNYDRMYGIKFINTSGIMSVTGDYGNWIFCREFHPSSEGFVSDGYWMEKLKNSSSQEGYVFDSDATKEEIQLGIDSQLEGYGFVDKELTEAKEYYKELLDYVELSEWEYTSFAYQNHPNFFGGEMVPHQKETKVWLKIIFDAFDEICSVLKKQEDFVVSQIKSSQKGLSGSEIKIPDDMIFPFNYEDDECLIEMKESGHVNYLIKRGINKIECNVTILPSNKF